MTWHSNLISYTWCQICYVLSEFQAKLKVFCSFLIHFYLWSFFQLIYFILIIFFRLGCSATSCLTRSWWPQRTQSTFWLRKRKSNFSKRSSRTSTRPSLLSSSWSETRWFQFYQITQLLPAFSVLVETFSKISYWRILHIG